MSSYPTTAISQLKESYDYIIVGGGTAGCVLANRLSRDTRVTVLLVERGGVGDSWLTKVPLLSTHFASDGSRSRVWESAPQVHLNGRKLQLIGGNSLGGTSKINSMLYTRGLAGEYNSWMEISGSEEWKYDNLRPYFEQSETNLDVAATPDHGRASMGKTEQVMQHLGGDSEWPHRTSDKPYWPHTQHIIKSTSTLGLPYVEDPNIPYQPSHGCTKIHFSIDRSGHRSATSSAFLPKQLVKSRATNLHICTETLVHRIQISDASGEKCADGVWLQRSNVKGDACGPTRYVKASKEVILSAGPIGSPHIMLLSGIGPKEHLEEHGIPVTKDLPGVGSHLQDHFSVPLQFQVPLQDSLVNVQLRPWLMIKEMFLYLVFGVGLLLAPVLELSVFLQTRLLNEEMHVSTHSESDVDDTRPESRPDIEIMPIANGETAKLRQGGLSFFVVTLRPTSLGTVRLTSSNPFASPFVDLKCFSTEHDRAIMRKGLRFGLRMKEEIVRQGYPISDYHVPKSDSDVDLDSFAASEGQSTYHYSSTCRMAPEVEGGVVDARLRVYGIKNLRIVDSSVFPEIVGTHLAAPTVVVAEKGSAMILKDA